MTPTNPSANLGRWLIGLAAVALVAAAWASAPRWRPFVFGPAVEEAAEHADEHDGDSADDSDAHGHEDHDHDDPNHIDLSPQAQRNIGLKTGEVTLGPFQRTVTIPGIVAERPGRTSVAISAPLTGVVRKIFAVEGEAVLPGDPLFVLRLTHEEIVQGQADFLQTSVELEVVRREVARLEKIAAQGAIAGKTLLERQYEQEKLEAALAAQRESLILHGVTAEQTEAILRDRRLLQDITVYAPLAATRSSDSDAVAAQTAKVVWLIKSLNVAPGQHVEVGATLATAADYRMLYIEGRAFERDAREIHQAIDGGWPVAAIVETAAEEPQEVAGLKVAYASGQVDVDSRALHFYVTLPNEAIRDARDEEGRRFVEWRFKPGQRVDLRVPVERWENRIVLPAAAVVREGAESFVFQVNGNAFLRRPVHEEYRDQSSVVIANDGSIFPGDVVALTGAQQMQIAVKNKMGGAPDPHAGHNH